MTNTKPAKFFIFVLLLSYFLYFLIIPVLHLVKAYESTKWPKTTGSIVLSNMSGGEGSRGGTHYWPIVKYSYSINNNSYIGNTIFFSKSLTYYFLDDKYTREMVHKYPVGSQVYVFYNPNHPLESCLMPGISKFSAFFIIIATLLFFAFIIL